MTCARLAIPSAVEFPYGCTMCFTSLNVRVKTMHNCTATSALLHLPAGSKFQVVQRFKGSQVPSRQHHAVCWARTLAHSTRHISKALAPAKPYNSTAVRPSQIHSPQHRTNHSRSTPLSTLATPTTSRRCQAHILLTHLQPLSLTQPLQHLLIQRLAIKPRC